MTNNINPATPGTEPVIPCRALVSLLGWAMELHRMMDVEDLEEHNTDLFEAFMLGDVANEQKKRSMAIFFNDHMLELITAMHQLTYEETGQLNKYLLSVCNEQMKSQGQ